MLRKYMTLDELSDWAATELYEVTEYSDSVQLSLNSHKRTVISGFRISENKTKKELLKKIIKNPNADWKNLGVDEKIIEQIFMAKHDNSDQAKKFMNDINMFVADFNADVFKYAYKHIKEINNRLVKTFFSKELVHSPSKIGSLKGSERAELWMDLLLYNYPYTDQSLIGGYAEQINLYDVSHNYDMYQVYEAFYQYIWNRILAEASKAKSNTSRIENLCNVAIVKLIGINNSRSETERDKNLSEDELRKVFNTKNVSSFIKEHAAELKQKQYQDLFNQIRMNEAQALLYKQATDKRREKHEALLMQANINNNE